MQIKNKTVLITGAARGIGAAIAKDMVTLSEEQVAQAVSAGIQSSKRFVVMPSRLRLIYSQLLSDYQGTVFSG